MEAPAGWAVELASFFRRSWPLFMAPYFLAGGILPLPAALGSWHGILRFLGCRLLPTCLSSALGISLLRYPYLGVSWCSLFQGI